MGPGFVRVGDRGAAESMLLSGDDPDGSFLRALYQETRGVRRIGSAALTLCYLASETADAVWERDTDPWDVAAGLPIAREAGHDQHGEPYGLRTGAGGDERMALLGSNGSLHDQPVGHLRQRRAAGIRGTL